MLLWKGVRSAFLTSSAPPPYSLSSCEDSGVPSLGMIRRTSYQWIPSSPQGLFVKIGPSPACTPAVSKVKAMWVFSNMRSGDRDVITRHVNGMQVAQIGSYQAFQYSEHSSRCAGNAKNLESTEGQHGVPKWAQGLAICCKT